MNKVKKKIGYFCVFIAYLILFFGILYVLKEIALGHYLGHINFSNPVFNLDYALNEGASFGLLKQCSAFLCGVAAFILCCIFGYVFKKGKKISSLERISLAIISAGIISNTLERLQNGAVIDYINLNFITFPVFNFADVFICTGAILLIFILFFKR